MGWFDGGASKEDKLKEKGFTDGSAASFDSSPNMYAGGSSPSSAGGGNSGLAEFQQFSLQIQQQILVQQAITEISQKAFDKCCKGSTRESALTGKEAACIASIANKWLDANEFMAGRLQRKQQQASGQQKFS